METETRKLSIGRVLRLTILGVSMFVLGFISGSLIDRSSTSYQLISPMGQPVEELSNPYPAYSFAALRSLNLTAGPIVIEELMDSQPGFSTYLVSWDVPNLETKQRDRVSGQMNIPAGSGPYPVIIMLRGYVDRDIYQTGIGTRNAAAEFAKNGYITIAPDFLGYGASDAESSDVLIARFSRPITVLQLLTNLNNIRFQISSSDEVLEPGESTQQLARNTIDSTRLGFWAHSNGGQIALSVLEITSKVIPTTLWAPVSKPFPFSVFYYTGNSPDGGRFLRQQISQFEFVLGNDPADFSILNEPARILAPVQIHQGEQDNAVPVSWSQDLFETLQVATVSAQLFTYPQADHNMQPDWSRAVQRDLQFFARHLQ